MNDVPPRPDADFRYMDKKGNILKTRTQLTISQMLDFFGIEYEYDHKITLGDGSTITMDFKTPKGLIKVVDGEDDMAHYERVKNEYATDDAARIIAVGNARHVARADEMSQMVCYDEAPQTGSIFLEDESFSFDYAHILPLVEKCSILHGHTSSVMVELIGQMKDNLLVDFGEAKRIIREVVAALEHKFFISERYVAKQDDSHYTIQFEGPRGLLDLQVPMSTT